jgi:F-type H+-transporting ATPase subunit b
MPQFDVTWFSPQLFWLAVLFLVLAVAMYVVAVPLVGGTIERRARQIDQDLERAGKLKAEIDLVIAAREKAIAEARAQAADLLRGTRDRLAHIAAEKQRETAAALHEQIKAAERRIERAKATALKELHAVALDAARTVTTQLVGTGADQCSLSEIVDDVIGSRA